MAKDRENPPGDLETSSNWELVNQTKHELENIYTKMVAELNTEIFNELLPEQEIQNSNEADKNPTKKEEIKINEQTIDIFKSTLIEQMKSKLNKIWNVHNISINLKILELLKENYKNNKKSQWRPTGKTPNQQLIDFRVHNLQKRIELMDKELQQQKINIENTFIHVQENQQFLLKLTEQREKLLYEMERKQETFPIIKNKICELREKIVDLGWYSPKS